MSVSTDVTRLGIEELQQGYAQGTYTTETVVRQCLERIRLYDGQYKAFISINPHALSEARALDERRAAGEQLGALAGVPVAVKDSIDVAGLPTTAGWSGFAEQVGGIRLIPESDAPAIARLRSAGAIIIGKTNLPVFSTDPTRAAGSWFGPTFNAVDRRFSPGGSSSGSATAIAASFAMLGIAEETSGSIQNPATAQALVGIKPTFALVPNTGAMPLGGSTRDVIGPITKTVRDAAVALDVLAGFTAADPKTVAAIDNIPSGGYTSLLNPTALRGKRIGLYGPGWRKQPLSAETQALYVRAQSELEARGAILIQDPFADSGMTEQLPPGVTHDTDGSGIESMPYDLEEYLQTLGHASGANSQVHSLSDLRGRRDPFAAGAPLQMLLAQPGLVPILENPTIPPDLSAFRQVRERYLTIFRAVMDEHRLDALIFPQQHKETPLLASEEVYGATTTGPLNIAGLPAVTVPAGYYKSGSPFGLVVVGRLWSEASLLALAYDYEQATHHRREPALTPGH